MSQKILLRTDHENGENDNIADSAKSQPLTDSDATESVNTIACLPRANLSNIKTYEISNGVKYVPSVNCTSITPCIVLAKKLTNFPGLSSSHLTPLHIDTLSNASTPSAADSPVSVKSCNSNSGTSMAEDYAFDLKDAKAKLEDGNYSSVVSFWTDFNVT